MDIRKTAKSVQRVSWTVAKLILPIYLITDIFQYFGLIKIVAFLFEPLEAAFSMPAGSSLAMAGGGIFNLYTGVALGASIGLTAKQWTILGVFLGFFHSMLIESAILKKLGIPLWISVSSRLFSGVLFAYLVTFVPDSFFGVVDLSQSTGAASEIYSLGFAEFLLASAMNATVLCLKVLGIIAVLIVLVDFLKSLKIYQRLLAGSDNAFKLIVGLLLGVTYGAGLLLADQKGAKNASLVSCAVFLNFAQVVAVK